MARCDRNGIRIVPFAVKRDNPIDTSLITASCASRDAAPKPVAIGVAVLCGTHHFNELERGLHPTLSCSSPQSFGFAGQTSWAANRADAGSKYN